MHTSFGPRENDGRFVFPSRFRWGKHASVGFVIEFLSFVEFDLCIYSVMFFSFSRCKHFRFRCCFSVVFFVENPCYIY